MLADKDVTKIAAEKFGDNMIGALNELGIDVIVVAGFANEVLPRLLKE